jgi:hypothetical protein
MNKARIARDGVNPAILAINEANKKKAQEKK